MWTKYDFKLWAGSILYSNEIMHERHSPHSMCALPADVAHFDARAAELLARARQAHDELATYLRTETEGK